MKIIIGLGNPGEDYSQTRHNLGFRVINELSKIANIELSKRRYNCRLGEGKIKEAEVVLAKPMTWMNLSGQAVELLMNNYSLKPSDLLIIYDDTNLELGQIRVRKQGSAGGHNGVASIIQTIGSQGFPRLRMGIGSPKPGITLKDFVLSRFSPVEEQRIQDLIKLAVEAIMMIMEESIEAAMNKYNCLKSNGTVEQQSNILVLE